MVSKVPMKEPEKATMSPTNGGKSDLKFMDNYKGQTESVRLTYWEKINQKKELKKRKTEWLLKNQQKKTFDIHSQKNEKVVDKHDAAINLLNIGNASEVGQR